jgi:DNA-directed RNA polymerase subunit RPC12/RpoP
MSDSFQMLVDADVTVAGARDTSRAVLAEFRKRGMITGKANGDCVLGGKGYQPGPSIPGLYASRKNEIRFWELQTCGVEVKVGRGFNVEALGQACEGLACPCCGSHILPFDDDFDSAMSVAVREWLDRSGRALVRCPQCSKKSAVTKWQCTPPLGFGNLSFRFWNWPPFDVPAWKIEIPDLVQKLTGHTIVVTEGHV